MADMDDLTDSIADIDFDIKDDTLNDAIIVTFDLETTGGPNLGEIIQISASCNCKEITQFIIPAGKISPAVTEINGFEKVLIGNEIKLYRDSVELNIMNDHEDEVNIARTPKEGLLAFLKFLADRIGPSSNKVLLVAHNCLRFDALVIVRQMKEHDLFERFQQLVLGFVDTISVFKTIFPKMETFRLQALADKFLNLSQDEFEELDAAGRVEILLELAELKNVTDNQMKKKAKYLAYFINSMPENVDAVITSLEPIGTVVTNEMLVKIAKAGISIDILLLVYTGYGDGGISRLLRGDVPGIFQVTSDSEIIQSITAKLLSTLEQDEVIVSAILPYSYSLCL